MPLSRLPGAPGIFQLIGGRRLPVSCMAFPLRGVNLHPVFIRTPVTVDQGPP